MPLLQLLTKIHVKFTFHIIAIFSWHSSCPFKQMRELFCFASALIIGLLPQYSVLNRVPASLPVHAHSSTLALHSSKTQSGIYKARPTVRRDDNIHTCTQKLPSHIVSLLTCICANTYMKRGTTQYSEPVLSNRPSNQNPWNAANPIFSPLQIVLMNIEKSTLEISLPPIIKSLRMVPCVTKA